MLGEGCLLSGQCLADIEAGILLTAWDRVLHPAAPGGPLTTPPTCPWFQALSGMLSSPYPRGVQTVAWVKVPLQPLPLTSRMSLKGDRTKPARLTQPGLCEGWSSPPQERRRAPYPSGLVLSRGDLQCRVNFYCTAKRHGRTYVHFSYSLLSWSVPRETGSSSLFCTAGLHCLSILHGLVGIGCP